MTSEQPGTILNPETGKPFRARDLKVVDNTTPEYMGGYTVEFGDWIAAGPYVTKGAAKDAKEDLVAGRPLRQPSDGRFS